MASFGEHSELSSNKRTPILTEKMQAFRRATSESAGSQKFPCSAEGCTKVFTSQPGLRYHKKTSHNETVPEFSCEVCHRTFKSKNGLIYHKRSCAKPVNDEDRCADKNEEENKTGQPDSHVQLSLHVPSEKELVSESKPDDCLKLHSSLDKKCPPALSLSFKPKSEEEDLCVQGSAHFTEIAKDSRPVVLPQNFKSNLEHGSTEVKTNKPISHSSSMSCPVPLKKRPVSFGLQEKDPELCAPGHMVTTPAHDRGEVHGSGMLEEFAVLATGPQSPLLQRTQPKVWDFPVPRKTNTIEPSTTCRISVDNEATASVRSEETTCLVTSSSSHLPATKVKDDSWSHDDWPRAVWKCFIPGTLVGFVWEGQQGEWQRVEDLATKQALTVQASNPLRNVSLSLHYQQDLKLVKISLLNEKTCHLYFSGEPPDCISLVAECAIKHPFYVKGKGWSSLDQELSANFYGIPCTTLEVGDICMSHDQNAASFESDTVQPSFTSAVLTLSKMAQQRQTQGKGGSESMSLPFKQKPEKTESPKTKRKQAQSKAGSKSMSLPFKQKAEKMETPKTKRPTNAFLLFARENRAKVKKQHPGKDNRSVSITLGEEWKKMSASDQKKYFEMAKSLNDEQKKKNPDCWKRKK